ncbi:MAG: FHA domain-containing protein [Anaerolineae bacterium]
MKRFLQMITVLCIVGLFVGGLPSARAEGLGPLIDVLGKPDTKSNPPNINAHVSVVDPNTGRSIPDLTEANFSVQVSEEEQQVTVTPETRGVAVSIVIDRGGIARRGDPRIGRAVDLADRLLEMLNVDGTPSADMVSLIGIRGREEGGLTPAVPFTDYDPNLIRNEFDALRTEVVPETTPLYDGIDRAIKWLTDNPDSEIQDKVDRRRKLIVIFSDGIDNKYSSEAHETRIIQQCNDAGILLYTVRMSGGPTDADNMETLAVQTSGLYVEHLPDTEVEVITLFENIVTQREAYRLTFPLYRPQGDYQATVRVLDTPIGDDSTQTDVSSRLKTPNISLVPPPELSVNVPYSRTQEGFLETLIPLQVQVEYPDGIERAPAEVTYYANGVRIGTSTAAPDYVFNWDVTKIVTPTETSQTKEYTLLASANDVYLETEFMSDAVDVKVTWEAEELTLIETIIQWVTENWWLLLILAALVIGLIVLLIMLIRTKGQIARTAVKRTTGAIRGMTQRLTAGGPGGGAPARGKLVIIKGANVGREFKLSAPIAKVGRDPQFSDFALYDQYVSNPHFAVIMEQDRFFVQDENSTNGTKLNGTPLQPMQRYPLQQDAVIEAGSTQIQFKRLGGPTRRLGTPGGGGGAGAGGGGSQYGPTQIAGNQGGGYGQPQQPSGGGPGYAGPTQPAQPPAGGPPQGGGNNPNRSW